MGKVPIDLLSKHKEYTIASLPATESPAKLAQFYAEPKREKYEPEPIRRAIRDLVTFKIPAGLSPSQFDRGLGEAFRKTAFVRDFVELLKEQTMYPEVIPGKPNPTNPEFEVYQILKKLPANYSVLYSKRMRGGPFSKQEAEIDFIVTNHRDTLLFPEVKGGLIAYNGASHNRSRLCGQG